MPPMAVSPDLPGFSGVWHHLRAVSGTIFGGTIFGHLHRLLSEYVAYYHEDRPHLTLGKDTPCGRPVERPPQADAKIVAFPRVGGLHHRYARRVAA